MTNCRMFSRLALLCLLIFSGPSAALNLIDGQNFRYDIGADGVLNRGTLNAYANMYRLRVNNVSYVGDIIGLSNDGREVLTSPYTLPNTPITVQRRFYVSKSSNFARYSELLRNDSDNEQVVTVQVFGNLGAGNLTQIVSEPPQANFLVTDDVLNDKSGSMPVLMHYHSQINNPIQATHRLEGNQLSWVYRNLVLPPNSQRRIIYFIAQMPDLTAAERFAARVLENPTALFENIPRTAYAELLNFIPALPDPEQDFSAATFLNPGEIPRQGELTETDSFSQQRAATYADFYAVNLNAGQTITLQAAASFDTYLYIFADEAGTELLAQNDDAQVNTTNSTLTFSAPRDGTYYIEITAHTRRNLGKYSLTVLAGDFNHLPLAYNFAFSPQTSRAPTEITFTDFSRDRDGEIVERCWQFGDGTPIQCQAAARITHQYTQAGRFSVGLTLRDNDNGLSFHSEPVAVAFTPGETDVILPIGDRTRGELSPSDAVSQTRSSAFADRYIIQNPTPDEALVLTLESTDFDGYLYLYDSFNHRIRQNNNGGGGRNAQIRYTPLSTQPLLVEVSSFNDSAQGNYTLELARVSNNTPVNILLEASVNPNNSLQWIFLARLPSELNANFFAWDLGDGSPIKNTAEPTVAHRFTESGLYDVTVTANNAQNQQASTTSTFIVGGSSELNLRPQFSVSPQFGERPLRTFFSNETTSTLTGLGEELRYVWHFGDGEVATEVNPVHTYQAEGTYQVVLEVFSSLTQQSAAFTRSVVVFDRNTQEIPITSVARERPQVLMAGFDPMRIDLIDTSVRVFAIVRTGGTPLQTVRLLENESGFNIAMSQVATYDNGDQRYEAVYTFPRGQLSAATLSDFFGIEANQFRVQAQDQAGQFHAYPNIEIGDNPRITAPAPALFVKPTRNIAIRRAEPQVLAAGLDPILIDTADTDLTVTALVRSGLKPITSVVLKQVARSLQLPMRLKMTLPNGDSLYQVVYTYPVDDLASGTVSNFFGSEVGQFEVVATDQAGQQHRYPAIVIGNYLRQ